MKTPRLTRQTFEFIAEALHAHMADARQRGDGQAMQVLAKLTEDFAWRLAATNPRFDRSLFWAAVEGK
jgi:hypothetical protein